MKRFAYMLMLLLLLSPAFKTQVVDSLLKILSVQKSDSDKVKIFNQLAREFRISGNYSEAISYSQKALSLADKAGYKNGAAAAYSSMGTVLQEQGNYNGALKNFLRALEINKELNHKRGLAAAYNNVGLVYSNMGNYTEALRHYFHSLKIKEEFHDEKGVAATLNNIGITYRSLGNTEEALKNYQASLQIKKKLKDQRGLAASYTNMGIIYTDMKKSKEAIESFMAARQIYEQTHHKADLVNTLINIGVAQELDKNFDAALDNYKIAVKISSEINNRAGLANAQLNIGAVMVRQKKFKEAKPYLLKALSFTKQSGYKEESKSVYSVLASADSALGQWTSALEYYNLYVLYSDSLVNEENTRQTVQQQMQYDFDKKSTADSIKNAEAKRMEEINHQSEIRNQKLYTYIGLAGFVVMIVTAIISLIAFRNKRKANIEIAHQKAIVEEKQKEVLDSIHYAKRIQYTLLTSAKYIEKNWARLRSR